jgi:phage-related protein
VRRGVILHDIKFYRDSSGVQPAKEYIRKLQGQNGKDARIQAKQIAIYIQLLAEKGFSLSKNYIDKINEEYNIWELRPGSNRVFFVAWIDGMFGVNHFFRVIPDRGTTSNLNS